MGGKNSRAKRESDKAPSEHGDGATPGRGAGNLVFLLGVNCQPQTPAKHRKIQSCWKWMECRTFPLPFQMIQWISPRLEGFTECILWAFLHLSGGKGIRDLGKNG